jgi:hypothetical protein
MNTFIDAATKEVLNLHSVIASWYRGDASAQAEQLDQYLSNFHPDFTMIAAAGRKHGRAAFGDLLKSAYGSKTELDIEIFDLEVEYATDDQVIFTLEEQRRWERNFQRRISSAVLVRAEDGTPQWLLLQQTWIEDPK